MIIEPDFLDHWKTRALVDLSKKPESPLWLIRLWAHCHSRRAWQFTLPPIALKSICGVSSDIAADDWFKWLKECRFIEGSKTAWEVHDWAKHNAGLLSRWANGRQPKAKRTEPEGSGAEAEPKRTEAPLELRPPDREDREDRVEREEGAEGEDSASAAASAALPRVGKPTSFGEVEAFIVTSELQIAPASAAKFFDHFEANGWRTRTGPLRDWRAALRNWARRESEFAPPKNSGGSGAPPSAGQLVSNPLIFK
jgi:hypothetical protein